MILYFIYLLYNNNIMTVYNYKKEKKHKKKQKKHKKIKRKKS